MKHLIPFLAACALFALVGCKSEEAAPKKAPAAKAAKGAASQPSKAAGVDDAAMAEAKQVYATRCATCHGPEGKGDGPAAAALNPKPRSLSDAEWQKSVTDEHIAKVTVKGGEAVGLSVMMAPNPDLESKPKVVDGLVKIVRGFAN